MWPFAKPKPAPPGVTIRNVLGEVIDRVEGVWDLHGADLKGRQWQHADLSGMSLDGANCEGIELFGSRLIRTSFCRTNLKNANLAYATVDRACFQRAELDNVNLLHSNIRLVQIYGAIVDPKSTIPGIFVTERKII
jgi:uncharacterized protein YjbI with pentapeptide repeats